MVALLVALALETRTFHPVPIAQLARTPHTHVHVCGTVTLVKHEKDGDIHIRIADGAVRSRSRKRRRAAFAVAEIVPYHPLPAPRKGERVCVDGISRRDGVHRWAEVHPVEAISPDRRER